MLTSGQAEFEVTQELHRPFRVIAGPAEVVDIGTTFDVRLERNSTVVTVVEGRVEVGPSPTRETRDTDAGQPQTARFVELAAGQQASVAEGEWPVVPVTVDVQSTTAWLRQEIVFDHEPLERVVSEYNRYTTKPIEIATPSLRNLPISGEFATNDSDTFIAFLRSLKGVRVEVTPTRINVSRD
jgi:transmembrane sensor